MKIINSVITHIFAVALVALFAILAVYHYKLKIQGYEQLLANMSSITTPGKLKLPLFVATILEHDDKFFLIQRTNTNWAEGFWNFPGGLVEPNETVLNAAIRETQEEVGVIVQPEDFEQVHVLHVRKSATNTQDIIGIYFKATKWTGTPHNAEPHKMTGAQWFAKNDLPLKLTEHAQLAMHGLKTGRRYSESGW